MTRYLTGQPFSVPMTGRDPAQCTHGWRDPRGACVFCGAPALLIAAQQKSRQAEKKRRERGKP